MFEPTHSLAWYKRHPLLVPRKISSLTSNIAKVTKDYVATKDGKDMATPDIEALTFYAMNHVFGVIQQMFDRDTPLPPDVQVLVCNYLNTLEEQAERLFHYMLLITTRESRHVAAKHSHGNDLQTMTTYPKEHWTAFLDGLSCGSSGAVKQFYLTAPSVAIHKYMEAIVHLFHKGQFSGGYGGEPWADIARNLYRMVVGEVSPEVFVDTSYTLAHNNGSCFNKGMLYEMYSGKFLEILDVQRSGQIPQYLREYHPHHQATTWLETAANILGTKDFLVEPTSYVDWYKVEGLGAVQQYPNHKEAQVKKYGHSTWQNSKDDALLEELNTPIAAESTANKVVKPDVEDNLNLMKGHAFVKHVQFGHTKKHIYAAYKRTAA